jgi:hypothetical protein
LVVRSNVELKFERQISREILVVDQTKK